jgi:hypothetical protein
MLKVKSDDIVVDLHSEQHFYSIVKQLVKDFNEVVFEERVKELTVDNVKELIEEVSLFLSSVCNRSITEFSQLMYVIDVPEKILAPFLAGGQSGWSDFTIQVIKREYLKVLIREKYSK